MDLIKTFDRIDALEPMGYKELLKSINECKMVLTDSGGIQEESCILQKKCIILRTNTERPETVEVGGAVVLNSISKKDIIEKYKSMLDKKVKWSNPFGDGKAGERIIKVLQEA
jgi:UDP-N-acetylglucosamine 2-epimerase (non-hydrolysing)